MPSASLVFWSEQAIRRRMVMNIKARFSGMAAVVVLALGMSLPVAANDAAKDAANAAGNETKMDIVDTAVAAGSFKTLAAALQAADLVSTLKGKGPFTVFAPTDEAFAKLPAGTVDALLKDKAKLTKILLYHVVSGNVMAKDVVKLKSARTVEGSSVRIHAGGGKVMVDGANVVKADIVTANGVIHVIDSVIMPK